MYLYLCKCMSRNYYYHSKYYNAIHIVLFVKKNQDFIIKLIKVKVFMVKVKKLATMATQKL